MNEEIGKQHFETNTDPLSRFMFGPSKWTSSENDFGSEERQERDREKELLEIRKSRQLEDDWLFGPRPHQSTKYDAESHSMNSKFNQIVNNINFLELMDNIDVLLSSANELKPLYKKISPLINQFLRK